MSALALFPLKAADHDLVVVTGKYAVASNGTTLSGLDMPGVTAVARTSEGLHTLTLKDKFAKVLGGSVVILKTTGSDVQGQVNADAALSGPNVSINFTRRNSQIMGGLAGAPTTASTQATGAGATAWNVNVAALLASVAGVIKELAAAADFAIHSATQLVANGQSCVAALVLKNVTGTISMVAVKGSAATTGAQVAPTDSAIQAAVGAGNPWIKLAECTLNRTGDTTVTQSQDNTKRPFPGVEAAGSGDLVANVADPKSVTVLVTLLLKASGVNS